jgi:hypothetical protein
MEITTLDDVAILLWNCVRQLSELEASFIEECHLAEPRKTLKAFAAEHGLKLSEMADLRDRAMRRLREECAAKNVHSLADIL